MSIQGGVDLGVGVGAGAAKGNDRQHINCWEKQKNDRNTIGGVRVKAVENVEALLVVGPVVIVFVQ